MGTRATYDWAALEPQIVALLAQGLGPVAIGRELGVEYTSMAWRIRERHLRARAGVVAAPAMPAPKPVRRADFGPGPLAAGHPYAVAIMRGEI